MRPDESEVNVPIPALLRAARGSYAHAIREHLVETGISDLPPNGAYILGGLSASISAGQLFREIGLRESALSRLLQALLDGGFVQPGSGEPQYGLDDLELTEKGRLAAQAAARGVLATNEELAGILSPLELSNFRKGLIALIDIKERAEHSHHDHDHSHEHGHEHEHEHEHH